MLDRVRSNLKDESGVNGGSDWTLFYSQMSNLRRCINFEKYRFW